MHTVTTKYSFLTFLLIAIVFLFSTSCKKNVDRHTVLPITVAFTLTSGFQPYLDNSTATMEMGYLFSVARDGTISYLGAAMSKAGTYKVTLWDADNQTLLAQQMITQTNDGEHQTSSIRPVSLVPGKTYLVSVTARPIDAHGYQTINSGPINYPLKYGSVTILGYREKSNPINAAIFPTTNVVNYAKGFPDVIFDAD